MAEKTLTNWAAFEKAGLVPVEVTCDGYTPVHSRNNGCHTRIAVTKRDPETGKPVGTADGIIGHILAQHGSTAYGTGFLLKLRQTEGKPWSGWAQLKSANVEVQDFRCDHCNKIVPLRPGDILSHMKPHNGKVKKSIVQNRFWMSLNFNTPLVDPSQDEFSEDLQ
jgi:hypothetical protein